VKCGVFALRKLTYVVCALLLPGHVGVAWDLQKQCTFGNQALSSHLEERGKKGKVFGIVSQLKKTE